MRMRIQGILLLGVIIFVAGGCATPQQDTDLPWNTPASWEGSPFIPGLSE